MTNTSNASYNSKDFFITPDRRCEQFLYNHGFTHDHMLKGETGWTYWVYWRTDRLNDTLRKYVLYLADRRAASKVKHDATA